MNVFSLFSVSSSQSWIKASKFQVIIAYHNHAIIQANIKLKKLVEKHQNIKLIILNIVHSIYILFLQNLSAQAQDGTSKIVDTIHEIVIKKRACQNVKCK